MNPNFAPGDKEQQELSKLEEDRKNQAENSNDIIKEDQSTGVLAPSDTIRKHLLIEYSILWYDLHIRKALTIYNAKTQIAITHLDILKDLKITALMLKKHPEVVTTIEKVCQYHPIITTSMNKEEEEKLNSEAQIIRDKAALIYNKFKSLFSIPANRKFEEVFEEEKQRFKEAIRHLDDDDIVRLTHEPGLE